MTNSTWTVVLRSLEIARGFSTNRELTRIVLTRPDFSFAEAIEDRVWIDTLVKLVFITVGESVRDVVSYSIDTEGGDEVRLNLNLKDRFKVSIYVNNAATGEMFLNYNGETLSF